MHHYYSRRKLSKIRKKNKIQISPPSEFKHIVHIGHANDDSNNDQKQLKAIPQAVDDEISTLPVVYSLIDADENENRSESIGIFFTGSTIQTCYDDIVSSSHKLSTCLSTDFYDNCRYETARNVIKKAQLSLIYKLMLIDKI